MRKDDEHFTMKVSYSLAYVATVLKSDRFRWKIFRGSQHDGRARNIW
jgi:hypothetical protein